jgi:hypothetical protein
MGKKLNTVRSIKERSRPNDILFTPLPVALKLIEMTNIQRNEKLLDPCRGEGVIYNNLPTFCEKDWAEITEGHDFFEYDKPVDTIICNPPFSIYTKWIQHCIKLNPQKIALVIGCLNLTTIRLKLLEDSGYYMTRMSIVNVRGWFSNTYLVLFEKNGTPILSYDTARY